MLALLTLLLVQANAPSPVVNLECTVTSDGQQRQWQITLNEAAGMVDYYTEVSGQQRRPARFTADAVYFIGFTLSRVDLTLHRESMLGSRSLGVERGSCRLVEAPGRAF